MPDIYCICEQLALYPGSRLGVVVYRLTYSEYSQWACFIDYLNTRVLLDLEDGHEDIILHIGWDVQEVPEPKGADDEEVRK